MRILTIGEMAEWSIAAVLKTVEGHTSGGSNPSLSANNAEPPAGYRINTQFYTPKVEIGCFYVFLTVGGAYAPIHGGIPDV